MSGFASWWDDAAAELFERAAAEPGDRARFDRAELLADDAAALRAFSARLVTGGATRQSAACRVVGRVVGQGLAAPVGWMLARAGAGLVADADDLRWALTPDGQPVGVDLGRCRLLVPPGHPWAGDPGVVVAEDAARVRTAAVQGLVEFAGPIVQAARRLGRVSAANLWAEVGDHLACVLNGRTDVTQSQVNELGAALTVPGVPWQRRPTLTWALSERLGPVHVARKGGCCLYFTGVAASDDTPDDCPRVQAYRARFPCVPREKRYCSTCPHRPLADVAERLVFWRELLEEDAGCTHG